MAFPLLRYVILLCSVKVRKYLTKPVRYFLSNIRNLYKKAMVMNIGLLKWPLNQTIAEATSLNDK